MATEPTTTDATLGGLFSRAIVRAFIVVGFVALAVGTYAWSRHRGQPYVDARADEAAWCRAQYATARTPADSSAVDARRPAGGVASPNSGRVCRELRVAHLTGR